MSGLLVLIAVAINVEIYQWFNISTIGITTGDFIMIFMMIMVLKLSIWDGKEIQLAKNPAIPIFYIFLGASLVSGIYPLLSGRQDMIIQFLKSQAHFQFNMSIVTVFILYKFSNESWNNFIKLWLIISVIINLFGIYQIIARALDLPFAWISFSSASFYSRNQHDVVGEISQISLRFESFFRATSFFSEPSALGAFNGVTLVFALLPKFKGFKPFFKSQFFTTLIIVLSVIGMLLAFSLTGATIVLLIMITTLLHERLNVFIRIMKILPFLLIFVIGANLIVESYTNINVLEMFGNRFDSIGDIIFGGGSSSSTIAGESVNSRSDNFNAMYNIWLSSPITGIGLGLTYKSPFSDGWAFSDTSLMAVLSEFGVFGIIPYLALFIMFYIQGVRFPKSPKLSYLDEETKRLLSLIIYLMPFIIVTNFISGNNLSSISSSFYIGLFFSITNKYYIDYEKEFYTIKLVKSPLRNKFIKRSVSFETNSYQNYNN